jgi:ubiquitin carboxyl-terminal hydrolase 4/11/15
VERPAVAPGFFFLGPVPAIIRCWLDTNFKHDTLLYAAVCSGSCESFLDRHLIERLGFEDCITADDGGHKIKMTVYLPEAVPTRSTSPAPQLPSLCVEFNVVDRGTEASDSKTIQIILGSDVLRAHNADILFSTNNLTLYDDEGTKLQIPLVRPEDEGSFKYLVTHRVNSTAGRHSSTFMKDSTRVSESVTEDTDAKDGINGGSVGTVRKSNGTADMSPATQATGEDGKAGPNSSSASLSVIGSGRREEMGTESPASGTGPGPRTGTSPAIWSNWRRDTERPGNLDWASGNKDGNSYQRRDGGIKVLKPTKTLSRSLSSGAPQGSSGAWGGQSRFFDDGKRRVDNAANGNNGAGEAQLKRAVSGEKGKEGPTTSTPLVKTPKAANPVGGASAFAWLKGGDIK